MVTIRSGSAAREANVAPGLPREISYLGSAPEAVGPALPPSQPLAQESPGARPDLAEAELAPAFVLTTPRRLSVRQKQVLAIVAEAGTAGPSAVARELGVGVSTAYRDLSLLEERGLLCQSDSGRRVVTDGGLEALRGFMHG